MSLPNTRYFTIASVIVLCSIKLGDTFTTSPPVTPPTCTKSSKFPAQSCYQYYECVPVWWWYESKLKTCPDGEAFDVTISDCSCNALSSCQDTTTTTLAPTELACSSSTKYPASSCEQYYECVSVWWWHELKLKSCPDGETYDDTIGDCIKSGLVNCKPTTTPTPATVTAPSCSKSTKYPAESCEQYYECVAVLWWFELKLKTCPSGQTYDVVSGTCITSGLVNCKPTTLPMTTTTVTTAVTVPSCSKSTKYPAQSCDQYYECVAVWWWFEPKLKTCPPGQTYDVDSGTCSASGLVNCKPTTVPMTTTTVTPAVTEPVCTGPTKYPGGNCNEYYECVPVWWWYESKLKECPSGQSYSSLIGDCVISGLIDCKPTTPHTTTPSSLVTEPTCTARSKYPAGLCYQYYECVTSWWWYELKLQTCPDGQGFDKSSKTCVAAGTIGCILPIQPPECHQPGRHVAPACYQYYECDQVLWWYTSVLKTCPNGQGFYPPTHECVCQEQVTCLRDGI